MNKTKLMAKKNSLLWEIQYKNHFKGYLFGSMHVPANLAFDNLERIHAAIDRCSCIATEIPLDHKSQFEMGKHMKLPNHVSLLNLLSEKKYEKFEQILQKSFNLSLDQFKQVLPLFLLNYMTQIAINTESSAMNSSMDLEFWNYATAKGKARDSVETLSDHLETLYNIPLSYQMRALKQALKNVSKFRKKSQQMLELYKTQDIHQLYAKSKKSLAGIREILLYRRNEIMLSNIVRISEEQETFFIVGAGHLSGAKGLIHSLKNYGYSMKPRKV